MEGRDKARADDMIRHLPYFLIVAEEQHFQRAADRLGIAQSALSRRIKLLELEMGVTLFERLPRGVRLTTAGANFYEAVRKIQEDLDQAREQARRIALGTHGDISVGINASSMFSPVVRKLFGLLRARLPNVQIVTKVIDSEDQFSALRNGEVEIGVLHQRSSEAGFDFALIDVDHLLVALPAEHPLASWPALRLEDLRDCSFAWPARSHSPKLSDHLVAACQERGFTPRIDAEVASGEAALGLVAMGASISFVSNHQALQVPASVTVREIEDFKVELPLCLAWRSDKKSLLLEQLILTLKAVVPDLKECEPIE